MLHTMSVVDLDALAIQRLPKTLLKGESDLYESKWWDYRFWHPAIATQMFALAYRKSFRRQHGKLYDVDSAAHVGGFKGFNILTEAHDRPLRGFWRARRAADEWGVPYDFWIAKAFEYALERHWHRIPTPEQLTANGKQSKGSYGIPMTMMEHIALRWNERKASTFLFGEHEFWTVDQYVAHPWQKAHMTEVVRQIKARSGSVHISLAEYIFERRMLPVSLATKVFGETLVARSRHFID